MKGYNTLSDHDKSVMLEAIGVDRVEDLFSEIPNHLKLKRALNLPSAMSEWELESKLKKLSRLNVSTDEYMCFLGAGKYNHFVPAVIDAIVSRGEFLTSYTPYQPEMSQGLLQALYEYQLVLSKVTGLDVVNSSSYDGATAAADAAWVCCTINKDKKKRKILVAESLWRDYREVLDTYMQNRDVEVETVAYDKTTGTIDLVQLEHKLKTQEPAGFLFQSPNAFGVLENTEQVAKLCREQEVISSLSFNPLMSGLFKTPGEMGVDIVTGEGQPFGIHLNGGGSSLGIFSTKKEYRKYVPGRLIGKVTDIRGNLAYSLVFEDREQHVAREKSTNNICSNQALNAIRAGIFLAYVGERGLKHLATINAAKAKYLVDEISSLPNTRLAFSGHYFNEFVVVFSLNVETIIRKLLKKKIFAGINYQKAFSIDNALLVSVTEKLSIDDMNTFVTELRAVLK